MCLSVPVCYMILPSHSLVGVPVRPAFLLERMLDVRDSKGLV